MALDRQSIEKRDFPIARRGYDPAAVDAHLAIIAAEVVTVQRDAGRPTGTESLASAASDSVRAIVDAAERSAAEIERQALEVAQRTDEQARSDAERTRGDAVDRAQEHVGQVAQATNLMLQRVDAMESELSALIEALRTGANRLSADLALLEGNMGELYGAASVGTMPPDVEFDRGATETVSVIPEPEPESEPEPLASTLAQDEELSIDYEAAPATRISDSPEPEDEEFATEPVAPVGAAGSSADAEGARLIALNMALNGQSREETDRYLAENFDLADRARLLDEVYSSLE